MIRTAILIVSAFLLLPAYGAAQSSPVPPSSAIEPRDSTFNPGLLLDGFHGFYIPTYDRVAGVTPRLGATYNFPDAWGLAPSIRGSAGYQTELGTPVGSIEGSLLIQNTLVSVGASHSTETNDRWLRGDLSNSWNYLYRGRDYRNYYDATSYWSSLAYQLSPTTKDHLHTASLTMRTEDAHSLPADDPWFALTSGSCPDGEGSSAPCPNPLIDDGRISSVLAGWQFEEVNMYWDLEADFKLEHASDILDSDYEFTLADLYLEWGKRVLDTHTLEVEGKLIMPLGGPGALPRQRWSYLGGSGTLRTLEFGELMGDHLAYLETKYIIPFRGVPALWYFGSPDLHLIHEAGYAWATGESADLVQNVGARVQLRGPYVRFMMDPEEPDDYKVSLGLSWPFGQDHHWTDRGLILPF